MASLDRSIVANVPIFAGLSAGDLDVILREARSVRYPKDSSVFDQGTEAHSFFVLLHGHLRVEKMTPQGQQIVVRYVSAGELFGVAQAMGLKEYPATAIAVVDSVALAGLRRRGRSSSRSFPRWPPERCRPSATDCRTPTPASSKCPANRSSSASRMRCCAWPNRPAARSNGASRSISRSAGRTSPK